MARSWFTTKPDKYFLRVPRRGHRNEVAFAIFALGIFGGNILLKNIAPSLFSNLQSQGWQQTKVSGEAFVVHPQEKYQLKFFA